MQVSYSMSSLIGTNAPDFSLDSSEGEKFDSSKMKGHWYVLFFYAKDGSPTCKRGCLSFKEQYHLFRSLEPPVEIVGVSQDTAEDHKQFKEELELPFTLLSDEDRAVANAFGVPVHLGRFPAKSSFVIDPEGVIRHVYDWQFRPRHHVAKILDALSSITE